MSSMYSDEEEEDYEEEIVATSDEDEQESPEDYCKGKCTALVTCIVDLLLAG